MARLGLLVAVAAFAGCSGQAIDETHSDAGIHQAPVSVIASGVGFPIASIALDFNGDVVAAHADHPILTVLDGMSLGPSGDYPVTGAPDPWTAPQLALGAEGNGYLFATLGAFYAVNMGTEVITVLVDAGTDLTTWTPRLDVAGVAFADAAGAVHRLDGMGVEDLMVPAVDAGTDGGSTTVESIAATLDGHLLILTSTNGVCTTLSAVPAIAGAPLTAAFGTSPCRLGLAEQAGGWLWVMGQTDGGAQIEPLRTEALGTMGTITTVTGISPIQVVVSADGTHIALLGAGPGYTVALAETANILSFDTPGDQGPWRVVTTVEVPTAEGGLFDDTGALYVADPGNLSVDIVQ